MLDDRQLENLIRMAAEIEAMEALASQTAPLRLVGEPVRPAARVQQQSRWRGGRGWVVALTAAAAACIAAIVVPGGLMTAMRGGTNNNGPIAKAPDPKTPAHKAAVAIGPMAADLWAGSGAAWPPALPWQFANVADEMGGEDGPQSMNGTMGGAEIRGALLAILEDDSGHVECVQWTEHNWDQQGSTLAEAKASDLVALSLMMTCNRTPHRMTVVGMRGPVNELPLGDAKAAELAACIVKAPGKCSSMSCCNPGASTECIPDDVNVRFERVSFR